MRFNFLGNFATLATLTGAVLAMTTAPAEAEWITYISHPLGVSFKGPPGMTMKKGTYRSDLSGSHDAIIYHVAEDNIEYTATVVDLSAQENNAANILGEAEYGFQEGNKILMDTFAELDDLYGRKIAVDHAAKHDRSTAAFYFVNGRLISVEATVLPANGDFGTPNMGLFVDSIAFHPQRVPPDSTELPPPK